MQANSSLVTAIGDSVFVPGTCKAAAENDVNRLAFVSVCAGNRKPEDWGRSVWDMTQSRDRGVLDDTDVSLGVEFANPCVPAEMK